MSAGVKRGPIHYDYEAPEGRTRVSNWIGWRCNLIKMSGITAHHSSIDTSLPGCWNHVWRPKSCALNIKNIAQGIPYLHKKMSVIMVQMQFCSVFHAWPEYKLHMIESVGLPVPAWQWELHKDPLIADSDLDLTFLDVCVSSQVGGIQLKGTFFFIKYQWLSIHAVQVGAAKARMHCVTRIL